MEKTVRKGRVNRHEKLVQVMQSGKPVTIEEFKTLFTGTPMEAQLIRMSQNICAIRCDGGIVKVTKNGRKVTSYQLVNYKEFDSNGRYIGVTNTQPVAAPVQSEAVEA